MTLEQIKDTTDKDKKQVVQLINCTQKALIRATSLYQLALLKKVMNILTTEGNK